MLSTRVFKKKFVNDFRKVIESSSKISIASFAILEIEIFFFVDFDLRFEIFEVDEMIESSF